METTARVQRWRQRRRDEGLEALTIWLTHDEKLRAEDLAHTWRCSVSELVQQALAQFQPGTPPRFGNDTATTQLHDAIATVLARVLPDQVRAILDTVHPAPVPVAATNGNVTATEPPESPAPTTSAHAYELEPAPARKGGRRRSALGQQILDTLAQHPEGLSAEQLRGLLTPSRPIGDVLSGMKKTGAVRTTGAGKQLRYQGVAS